MRRTFATNSRLRDAGGFALLDILLALAVTALVAAVVLPRMTRPPGQVEMSATANEIAALFRSDRNAAIRSRRQVVSQVDLANRQILSGAGDLTVVIPRGMSVEFVQSSREARDNGGGIRFYPDGRTSGGGVTLRRDQLVFDVNVNWLTAGVLVARRNETR